MDRQFKSSEDMNESAMQSSQNFLESKPRVLVAEDALVNQALVRIVLEKMGFQVTVVEDGRQVVEETLAGNYDLILMDIQMPNMDGYEATKMLREKGITTPIIAFTAHALQGDIEKCLESGCDEHIPKPFDLGEFKAILKKYASKINART